MSRLCVLFAANAGHGKDTAADMLAAELGKRGISTLRMAFADPIKEAAVHLLGIPKSISYGSQEDKATNTVYGKSVRHWLQWIGTELGRDLIHKDIWVHRFVEKALGSEVTVVIGSDCRFYNEIDVVRDLLDSKMGVMVIKIVRPDVPVNLNHPSESEIYGMHRDVFDDVVLNDQGLNELTEKVTAIADRVTALVT